MCFELAILDGVHTVSPLHQRPSIHFAVRIVCDVAGSLDGKIRVWSILDSSIIATVQLHQDMVTAVSFSLNGGRVMAGTMRGRVRFYDLADGKLEYVAQVRGTRAPSANLGLVSGSAAPAGLLRPYAGDVLCR
jgi:WD40 repeat protein